MTAGIYEIKNAMSDCVYICQSTDITRRITNHISLLKGKNHPNIALQEDYNKGDILVFSILETISESSENLKELLIEKEGYYLSKSQENGLVYNIQGVGFLGNKTKHDKFVKDKFITPRFPTKQTITSISKFDSKSNNYFERTNENILKSTKKDLEIHLLQKECAFWEDKYLQCFNELNTLLKNLREAEPEPFINLLPFIIRLIESETRGPDNIIHLEDLESLFFRCKLPVEQLEGYLKALKDHDLIYEPEPNRFKAVL